MLCAALEVLSQDDCKSGKSIDLMNTGPINLQMFLRRRSCFLLRCKNICKLIGPIFIESIDSQNLQCIWKVQRKGARKKKYVDKKGVYVRVIEQAIARNWKIIFLSRSVEPRTGPALLWKWAYCSYSNQTSQESMTPRIYWITPVRRNINYIHVPIIV